MKHEEIIKQINAVFERNEGIQLFYVESGSRLWGMGSPDSDYDVRGMHLQTKAQYFGYQKPSGVLEVSDGLFDFVSFDLDKLFQLLENSNPSCLEWLRAHLIYQDPPEELKMAIPEILTYYEPKALYHHYLSLAQNHLRLFEKKPTYKTTLYGLRGLFSAEVAANSTLPELDISKLFDQTSELEDLKPLARTCLEKKVACHEKTEVENRENIHKLLQEGLRRLEQLKVEPNGNRKALADVLHDTSIAIKTRHYG